MRVRARACVCACVRARRACAACQVESLTAARQSALSGNEPSDALRVVNALLTQLDQLKRCPAAPPGPGCPLAP